MMDLLNAGNISSQTKT